MIAGFTYDLCTRMEPKIAKVLLNIANWQHKWHVGTQLSLETNK